MAGGSVEPGWALVIVYMQNDFMHPGGSMAVKDKNARAACIAEVRQLANIAGWDLVVFTRDKHPAECKEGAVLKPGHVSFASSSYHTTDPEKENKAQKGDRIGSYKISTYTVMDRTTNATKTIGASEVQNKNYEKPTAQSVTYSFQQSVLQPGKTETTEWKVAKQDLWPDHCVMGGWGSDVVDELRDLAPAFRPGDGAPGQGLLYSSYISATVLERGTLSLPAGGARYRSLFFDKGMDRKYDAYSAVFENVEAVVQQQQQQQTAKREVRNVNPWSIASPKCTLTQILQAQGIKKVCVVGVAADFCVKETARGLAEKKFKVVVVKSATLAIGSKVGWGEGELTKVEAKETTTEFCREAWMQKSYVSSVWDSTSRAARKLYSQISFRLKKDTVQLLIARATLAQTELNTKQQPNSVSGSANAHSNNADHKEGFWLSKIPANGNYIMDLVRDINSNWGPMYTCLSSECRKPRTKEQLGDNRRPEFARVLEQEKAALTASVYSEELGLTGRAQFIAAIADLAMPFTSSMGPNVILLFEKTDASDYPYGKTRINVFDTGGDSKDSAAETVTRAQALLAAKMGFVDRYALAMLDLLLKNMETYLFDFTHVYKKGTVPEAVDAKKIDEKRRGYIAQMRQGVSSEYWLSLTVRGLSNPQVKLPFADCRDYFVVYDGLLKVYENACSFYSSGQSLGGEISQLTALKAFGWDWQLYFQTYVDSRQSKDDGAKVPQFSICSPHAQSFLYPVQGRYAQTDEEFMNAYERVVDRMADWFAKDYGSQDAVKPKAFVDAHACLHMCNQFLATQENKASPAPLPVNTTEPSAAKQKRISARKKHNFSPQNGRSFDRFESNSFSQDSQKNTRN